MTHDVMFEFEAFGMRPVPWSVAHRGFSNPALKKWQAFLREAAVKARGDRPHIERQIVTGWDFYLIPVRESWKPDWDNLKKAAHDAIQTLTPRKQRGGKKGKKPKTEDLLFPLPPRRKKEKYQALLPDQGLIRNDTLIMGDLPGRWYPVERAEDEGARCRITAYEGDILWERK